MARVFLPARCVFLSGIIIMKQHVLQLARIAAKKERWIIGLMSGTSLDGLDVALCRIGQHGLKTRIALEAFETIPYEASFKQSVRAVFAQKNIDFQELTLLNVEIAAHHAAIVSDCLRRWQRPADTIDLLASHGQTVFHAPRIFHGLENRPNATLQIGDGDHLARRTGIITISDFRQKHIAAGGEGAPLALYGDCFLFTQKGEDRILLNIGGIANFTWLPGNGNLSDALATDTGPGNTLLDAFARELFEVPYDKDALLASAGVPDEWLLSVLKSDPFFQLPFPKTSGPEYFSSEWVKNALINYPKGSINPYNLMATLSRLTADSVVDAVRSMATSRRKKRLFLSGGGAHNPLLVRYIREALPQYEVAPMSAAGLDGDAKEAVLFAVLANETVAGDAGKAITINGVPLVSMGKISFPG